jgi:hypothetical protein
MGIMAVFIGVFGVFLVGVVVDAPALAYVRLNYKLQGTP